MVIPVPVPDASDLASIANANNDSDGNHRQQFRT
jgi:hypothetical protein